LGEHVHQAGSVVEPDRLRFDFTHHGPLKPEQLAEIERRVNRGVWAAVPVVLDQKPYKEAVAGGAMALFGEKYGDVVRVVTIPGLSVELCGGTHVRNTSEIGLVKIVSETGVAAGVRYRRADGPARVRAPERREHALAHIADRLKVSPGGRGKRGRLAQSRRAPAGKRQLEKRLDEAMRGGGGMRSSARPDRDADRWMRVVASVVSVPDEIASGAG
jgi:alanyl-tRNA synthetase